MSEGAYELMALAARYWFVFLMAVIVFQGWRAVAVDNRQARRLRSQLRDAGCVGELLVTQDANHNRLVGKRYPVPTEGILGSARVADVRISDRSVARRHLWLRYGDGYFTIRQLGKAGFATPRTPDGRFVLCDGDPLEIGSLTFTLVLYDAQEIAASPEQGARAAAVRPPQSRESYAAEYDDEFWG